MPENETIPFLLTTTDSLGALAAAREAGRCGIPVHLAGSSCLTPARWSRHVRRRLLAPPAHEPLRQLEYLLRIGDPDRPRVLYPTCDETAWLFSVHRDRLGAAYRMFSPDARSLFPILNKWALWNACREREIPVPQTWFPTSDHALEALAGGLPYPVLLKPRTHVFTRRHNKGVVVHSEAELLWHYRAFQKANAYSAHSLCEDPHLHWPIIQRLYPEARQCIYHLSGFADRSAEIVAVRAAWKILQYPRRLGIGICFEDAPVERQLVQRVQKLLRATGYFGVFEIEFIPQSETGEFVLIDFSPRFYNQMAFDIARGLPVATLAYYAATGQSDAFARTVEEASRPAGDVTAYCNRFLFLVEMGSQRLTGRVPADEWRAWRQWRRRHAGRTVDPSVDRRDPAPALASAFQTVYRIARYPRTFRQTVLEL